MDVVYENILDAVVCIDNDGKITRVNSATERMFFYSRDELIGEPVNLLIPTEESQDILTSSWSTFNFISLLGRTQIVNGKRKDGEIFQIEISLGEISSSCSSSPSSSSSSFSSFDSFYDDSNSTSYVATIRDLSHRTVESRYEKDFQELELLGRGGFGTVYKVRNILDDSLYAIKKIKIKGHSFVNIANHKFLREVKAMARLTSHVNVIRYYQAWLEKPQLRPRSFSCSSDLQKNNLLKESMSGSFPQLTSPLDIPTGNSIYLSPSASPISKPSFENHYTEYFKSCINHDRSTPFYPSSARRLDFNKNMITRFSGGVPNIQSVLIPQRNDFSESSSSQNTSNQTKDEDEEEEDEEDEEEEGENSSESEVDVDDSRSTQSSEENDNTEDSLETNQSPGFGYNRLAQSWHESTPFHKVEIPKSYQTSALHESLMSRGASRESKKKKKKVVQMILYIQMELCSSETLKHWLEQREEISFETNLNFFRQIISGLAHIHSQSFIHRDIKPANIFIDKQTVRIGDFGLVRNVQHTVSRTNSSSSNLVKDPSLELSCGIGTNTYAAPEQLDGKNYNEKVDLYASGIVLLEMFSEWGTLMEKAIVLNDLKAHRKIPKKLNETYPQIAKLVLDLTQTDPEPRPSTNEVAQTLSDIFPYQSISSPCSSPSSSIPPHLVWRSYSTDPPVHHHCSCCAQKSETINQLKEELSDKDKIIEQLKKQIASFSVSSNSNVIVGGSTTPFSLSSLTQSPPFSSSSRSSSPKYSPSLSSLFSSTSPKSHPPHSVSRKSLLK